MDSTARLWGRRVVSASISENAAFAVTDAGQLFVWGGKRRWWASKAGGSDDVPTADASGDATEQALMRVSESLRNQDADRAEAEGRKECVTLAVRESADTFPAV